LIYKNEYLDIQAIVRYHRDLTEEGKGVKNRRFSKGLSTFQLEKD